MTLKKRFSLRTALTTGSVSLAALFAGCATKPPTIPAPVPVMGGCGYYDAASNTISPDVDSALSCLHQQEIIKRDKAAEQAQLAQTAQLGVLMKKMSDEERKAKPGSPRQNALQMAMMVTALNLADEAEKHLKAGRPIGGLYPDSTPEQMRVLINVVNAWTNTHDRRGSSCYTKNEETICTNTKDYYGPEKLKAYKPQKFSEPHLATMPTQPQGVEWGPLPDTFMPVAGDCGYNNRKTAEKSPGLIACMAERQATSVHETNLGLALAASASRNSVLETVLTNQVVGTGAVAVIGTEQLQQLPPPPKYTDSLQDIVFARYKDGDRTLIKALLNWTQNGCTEFERYRFTCAAPTKPNAAPGMK